jgi:hypothetical protein
MTHPHGQKEDGPPAVPSQPLEEEPSAASPPPAEPPSSLRILKSVGESAGVIAGLAFISGWLYWATYYAAFGLNPLVLDFAVAVVSVSQVQVVIRDWKTEPSLHLVLVPVLVVCAAMIVLFGLARLRRHWSAAGPLLLLAAGIPAGTLALGLHDAELDAGCNSRLPSIAFLLATPPDPADGLPDCLNNTLSCKLILHFDSVYHYFESPDCSVGGGISSNVSLATGEIRESEIRMVRIDRPLGW